MKYKIYIIAGESSGDYIGARLIQALKNIGDYDFKAIGGKKMEKAGAPSLFLYDSLGIIGFVEIIPKIFTIIPLIYRTIRDIKKFNPHMIITIDSPGFNLRIVRIIRKIYKNNPPIIVHYVAPTVWVYKPERAKTFAALYDALFTLFPFEPQYFTPLKLPTICVGHPIIEENHFTDEEIILFQQKYDLDPEKKIFLLLPGSRIQEIKKFIPLCLDVLESVEDLNLNIVIMVNDSLMAQVKSMITLHGVYLKNKIYIIDSDYKKIIFHQTYFALSKAGTISLELGIYQIPHVIFYKINFISAWILKNMMKIKHISLVNILSKQEIIPEFLQNNCTKDNLSKGVLRGIDGQNYDNVKQKLVDFSKNFYDQNPSYPSIKAASYIQKLFEKYYG